MMTIKQEDDGINGKFSQFEDETPVGEMLYTWAGKNKFVIDHTETYKGFEGKGYAKQLVNNAVEFAREKGVKIIPLCQYAKTVLVRNPDFNDIIYNNDSE